MSLPSNTAEYYHEIAANFRKGNTAKQEEKQFDELMQKIRKVADAGGFCFSGGRQPLYTVMRLKALGFTVDSHGVIRW